MRKLVSLKKCKTSEVYLCGIFIPNIAGLCSNVYGEVTHFKNWKIFGSQCIYNILVDGMCKALGNLKLQVNYSLPYEVE